MGHRIGTLGLQPDPEKVEAVLETNATANLEELQRLSGLVTFPGRLLPHMSTVMEPLQNLMKKDFHGTCQQLRNLNLHLSKIW